MANHSSNRWYPIGRASDLELCWELHVGNSWLSSGHFRQKCMRHFKRIAMASKLCIKTGSSGCWKKWGWRHLHQSLKSCVSYLITGLSCHIFKLSFQWQPWDRQAAALKLKTSKASLSHSCESSWINVRVDTRIFCTSFEVYGKLPSPKRPRIQSEIFSGRLHNHFEPRLE